MEMNPNQQAVLDDTTSREILVVAGPGSGKTRTMTEKIKREVREGTDPREITVMTFTNAAAQEMRERIGIDDLGYCGTLHGWALRKLIGTQQYRNFTIVDQQNLERIMTEQAERLGITTPLKELLAFKRTSKNPGKNVKERQQHQTLMQQYRKEMEQNQTFDLDLILYDCLMAIESTEIDTKSKWLFVDEYQDSGAIDQRIYRTIQAERKMFVGDPDQSIYRFRGGDMEGIMRMSSEADQTYLLDRNYRSTSLVCRAANQLIGNNRNRIEKMTLSDTDGKKGELQCCFVDNEAQELRKVDGIVGEAIRHGIDPNDIAVLSRTNREADAIQNHLIDLGIPTSQIIRRGLPDDWERFRRLMSMMINPNDISVRNWIEIEHGTEYTQSRAEDLRREVMTWQEWWYGQNDAKALKNDPEAIMTHFGISEESREIYRDHSTGNLTETAAQLFDLQNLNRETGDGVEVTTMHKSKGREWELVVITGLEQGAMPGRTKDPDRLEEDRRLMFVAITRAKLYLRVLSCRSRKARWGAKRPEPKEQSQFIQEMGL